MSHKQVFLKSLYIFISTKKFDMEICYIVQWFWGSSLIFKERTERGLIPENSSCIKAVSSAYDTFFFLCSRVKEPPCSCRFNLAKTWSLLVKVFMLEASAAGLKNSSVSNKKQNQHIKEIKFLEDYWRTRCSYEYEIKDFSSSQGEK